MNCATHPDRETAAYCRVCGKPLCSECVRNVRGAIYCEGCLAAVLSGAPVSAPAGVPAGPHAPNPAVAAALGFIPGLGAIYNGEYVKGLIHVAVFAGIISILNSVSNSGSGTAGLGAFFGIGLACFYFYMPIEAYRTARMKQASAYAAYAPAPPIAAPLVSPAGAPAATPGAAPSAGFAAGPAAGPGAAPPVAPAPQVPAPHPHSSMAGAIVLIVLGVLILFANLGWLTRLWVGHWWPLILIGLGVWLLWKRFHETSGAGGPRL